jgi:putative transposase
VNENVHYGRGERILEARKEVLAAAYEKHPERFKGKIPKPMGVSAEVWINKPSPVNDGGIH